MADSTEGEPDTTTTSASGYRALIASDHLEAAVLAQDQIHQRHVDHRRLQRADGVVDGRRGQRGVPVSARLGEEPLLQLVVGFDNQYGCTLHGKLSEWRPAHRHAQGDNAGAHLCKSGTARIPCASAAPID